jgi:uncharacterized protein YraI
VTPAVQDSTAGDTVLIPAIVGVKGGELYGADGALLATMATGTSIQVRGRTADSAWLAVRLGAEAGFVSAAQVIAFGLARLPVVEMPAAVATTAQNPVSAQDSAVVAAEGTAVIAATTPAATTPAVIADEPAPGSDAATLAAVVNTDQGRLNIRSGPGTEYAVRAKGVDGAAYTVIGRNDAGDWLLVVLDGGARGWAAAAYLEVDGDVSQLPLELAPAPAVQATETQPAATVAAGSTSSVITVSDSATTSATTSRTGAVTGVDAEGDLQGTIVFQQSAGGTIYAYDLQTGELRSLTHGFDPAISPDGATVAFVRDGGEMGLYLIDIDGSNERRIFERAALAAPKWSPDGQWIVFSRNDEGVECYQINEHFCMLPEEAEDRFPMGMPQSIPLVTEYQHKLSVVDRSGDNFHDVKSLTSAQAVDWSDAGIVYQSSAGIQITSDGEDASNQEVIFDNLNPYYSDPDLQPGGGQIVFQIKGAAQTDLWVVNTDGTGKMALTQPKTTLVDALPSNVAAAYSPDGAHIVFLSNRTPKHEAGEWHLWVMNADGSAQRQLPIDLAVDYHYGLEQVVSWGR